MDKVVQSITVDTLRQSRSLSELREWVDAVQTHLKSTKASRAMARSPSGALKNFCEEVQPTLVFLEHTFAHGRIRVRFPAGGADDAVVTLDENPRQPISLQIVTGFRRTEFARRMEMLTTRGWAPGFGPIFKTIDPTSRAARFSAEHRVLSRNERVDMAAKLISAGLQRKAGGATPSSWLIVDADLTEFDEGDVGRVIAQVTTSAEVSPFDRVYVVSTDLGLCRRIK